MQSLMFPIAIENFSATSTCPSCWGSTMSASRGFLDHGAVIMNKIACKKLAAYCQTELSSKKGKLDDVGYIRITSR